MGDTCVQRIKVFCDSGSHKMISPLICQCNEKIHKDIFTEHILPHSWTIARFCQGNKLLAQCSVVRSQIHDLPINHLDKWTQRISFPVGCCPTFWWFSLFSASGNLIFIWSMYKSMSLLLFKHNSAKKVSKPRTMVLTSYFNFSLNLQVIAVCQWY